MSIAKPPLGGFLLAGILFLGAENYLPQLMQQ